MLDKFTVEDMALMNASELVSLAFAEPEPTDLTGLDPAPTGLRDRGELTPAQKKLAILIVELTKRIVHLKLGYLRLNAEYSMDELQKLLLLHIATVTGFLLEDIEARVEYDDLRYTHLFYANDGLIYPCVGNCTFCQGTEEAAKRVHESLFNSPTGTIQ